MGVFVADAYTGEGHEDKTKFGLRSQDRHLLCECFFEMPRPKLAYFAIKRCFMNVFWSSVLTWSTLAAVAGFLARQAYVDWLAERRRRSERRAILVALTVEIQLNYEELEEFKKSFPSDDDVRLFLAQGNADLRAIAARGNPTQQLTSRPHFVFYYLDFVFKNNGSVLASLPLPIMKSVISYYGRLETISELADSISLPSFADISLDGRLKVIERIREMVTQAIWLGKSIQDQKELLLDASRSV